MFSIKAKVRDSSLKPNALRNSGEIPAVFYGAGEQNTPISVKAVEFKKVWRDAGESSTVKVSLPEKEIDALIHEVQTDPVTDEPIHADFLAVDMNKKIKVKIPLSFEGVSEAVKNGVGNLVKVLHEVEVEALPKDLPHSISVDITPLKTLEDTISIFNIKPPEGVAIMNSGLEIVASIIKQKEEVEEVSEPVDLSAIEVEKKGKKEEEGEEGSSDSSEKTEK